MDEVCMDDNTTSIEVKSSILVPNSDSSDTDDKFGEPQVLPRVGEQYQAEIPSLIALPDISQLTMNSEVKVNQPESFCKVESSCGASESVNSEERKVFSEKESAELKFEPIKSYGVSGSIVIDPKKVRGHSNSQSSLNRDKIYVDSYSELKIELDHTNIISGSLGESWSDTEYNSFLLSLYIFGKNLNLVKKFIGSKKMGDILVFYYGKFYRSKGYGRWSECRKLRTRRCIYGQKIFTGCRQQELLSRLFPHISEGCQNVLVELSRNFGEGKMPFEEYVFALKDAVGTDLLINSVAIGKGKQDLTGTAVEPTKTKHIFSVRSELPIGKACSSLTSADIIKFLTGNFRLSKARSSDLFWEAVWPRLLAKGWRSEQPKDHAVSGSTKQSLVFLIPGVKKFSRRRLVKGNHYFDSVSDVLNKVASDPGLLEIEVQGGEANVDTVDRQGKQDDLKCLSDKKQHCYLQPHGSNCNQDRMKFTVVDTSMVCGLGQRQVRELRSLPLQTMNISILSNHSSESDQDTSEESENAVEQTNTSIPVEESTDKGPSVDSSDCTYIPEALTAIEVAVENHKYDSDMINDEHSRETGNCEPIQPLKADCAECSPPFLKKQKLEACNHHEFIHSTENTSITRNFDLNLDLNIDLNESISPSNLCDESDGLVFSVGVQNFPSQYSLSEGNPKGSNEGSASEKGFILSVGVQNLPSSTSHAEDSSHRGNGGFASEKGFVLSVGIQNLPSTSSLAKSSPNRSNEGSASENYLGGEVFAENSETRPLIDLNISPEVDDEMERPLSQLILHNNDHQSANTSCFLSKLTQHNERREFPDDHKEEETSMINRRQSRRNRPLTTKALEALEYRFLNSKKKRKNVESSHNSPKSQCLHLGDRTMITAACDNDANNGMAGTHAEEGNLIPAYGNGINLNEEVQYSL